MLNVENMLCGLQVWHLRQRDSDQPLSYYNPKLVV